MYELVTADANMPFAIALTVMLGIAVLEGVAMLLGAGISGFIDSMLPELDVDVDIDVDLDADVDFDASPGIDASEVPAVAPLSRFLGWLRIGKVPILILLVILLTSFGLIGFFIQSLTHNLSGFYLPSSIASAASFAVSLPVMRVTALGLEKIMPKDETTAVTEQSLVGRVATITLGTAEKGSPAEAKVTDQHGLTHYVMLEPDEADTQFVSGQDVLLVAYNGRVYAAIENTNTVLSQD